MVLHKDSSGGGMAANTNKVERQKTTLNLPKRTHKLLAIAAITREKPMQDLVDEAVLKYLGDTEEAA